MTSLMHVHECPRTVAAVQVIVCVHVIIVVLMYTMHEGNGGCGN
jgi:preprotein translocase subunit SecG